MIKLPEPVGYFSADWSLTPYGMKLMQSRNPAIAQTFEPAYSKQAIRDALEEAAKLVQDGAPPPLGEKLRHVEIGKGAREAYAAAIRKLKEDIQ